ncbi:MAG: hypothetical protein KDC67_15870 [Ignavibacteriae bacterium]|nr:hypothetical protein [Ignavibacteriota bacterium]
MIFELLFRHFIVRKVGLHSRLFYFKLLKKENTSIEQLIGKENENSYYIQDFYNAVVGIIVVIGLSTLIAYLVFS